MAPQRKWWWEEITWTDVILFFLVAIFDILKLWKNRTGQVAEMKMEAFKLDLDDPTSAEKMKAYQKTYFIYLRVFFTMEVLQAAFLIKKIIPVAPAVDTQVQYRLVNLPGPMYSGAVRFCTNLFIISTFIHWKSSKFCNKRLIFIGHAIFRNISKYYLLLRQFL